MSHRRQQKEALRKEREERERKHREAQQRKRMVGYGAAGLLVAVVAIVLVVLATGSSGGDGGGSDSQSADVFPTGGSVPEQKDFEVASAAKAANCQLRSTPAKSRRHTTSLDKHVKYSTNPPDSGSHYVEPAVDGVYGKAPRDEQLVHGLEHGRVIIWAKPSLPKDERANLRALFDEDTYQMFLVSRPNMPYAVAASAWNAEPVPNGTGRLMVCKQFTPEVYDALRAFRDEHRSRGPEPVP